MMIGRFICACYFQRNIFLKDYKLHITFVNEEQFKRDYFQVLRDRGFEGDWKPLVQRIEKEIERRKENGKQSRVRKEYISKYYQPLHHDIYHLKESFFSPSFLNIVKYCKSDKANKVDLIKKMKKCKAGSVYAIPVFTDEFCNRLVEELKHFEQSDMPKGRPNTMNTTGLLLEEMGFYATFFDPLRTNYLNPVATLLFPQWVGESGIDSQRAFIVSYKKNIDDKEDITDLALHYDNAEVTLNLSLSDGFEGGELFFGGMWKEDSQDFQPVEHKHSFGVFHRGQHMHGAMPMENGERYNIIIWMRSSSIRNNSCPMCGQPPELLETDGPGDGFTNDTTVQVCSVV